MNRTTFLVDGFNLYHSVKTASYDLGFSGQGTRWLDIADLCNSYLHLIGNDAQTEEIFYFSALAKHLEVKKPEVTRRHRDYIRCLENSGVNVELHRFKKNPTVCLKCGKMFNRREEKETDVAIAARLFEVLAENRADSVVFVTGDTDIVPAVRTAQKLYPAKELIFMLPYKRHNKELANLTSKHFLISALNYTKHQFPDPYILPNNKQVAKPSNW
jgi:uncharacterized LabA/DUF88 family protein